MNTGIWLRINTKKYLKLILFSILLISLGILSRNIYDSINEVPEKQIEFKLNKENQVYYELFGTVEKETLDILDYCIVENHQVKIIKKDSVTYILKIK